jgi:hypothetical protein
VGKPPSPWSEAEAAGQFLARVHESANAGEPTCRIRQHQTGLAQAINLDLLETAFDAGQFQTVIELNLRLAKQSGHSTTWTFSDHDVARHATRYAPAAISGDAEHPPTGKRGSAWLLVDGP